MQSWSARRVTCTLLPDEAHHTRVLDLLRAAGSAGANLVTDAQITALAIAYRAEVHTADQDFRRFPGLECRFPLRAGAPDSVARPHQPLVPGERR